MMRTSTTVDPKMRTAIMRLKGEDERTPRRAAETSSTDSEATLLLF